MLFTKNDKVEEHLHWAVETIGDSQEKYKRKIKSISYEQNSNSE